MLNDLTKRLLSEGWTRDRHPDNVYWSDFENFGYKSDYIFKTVWETPCGLLVEGRSVFTSDVTYNGVWYCPENNNPMIRCPYGKTGCKHQPELLNRWSMCMCHRSDKAYNYDGSAEKVQKEEDKKAHEHYMEITGGQYCACVVGSNGYEGGRFRVQYDPETCIRLHCENPVCSVLKRERDLTKVNIFYDIVREKITRVGIIEDTQQSIEKGCKVFSKPVARTDAEMWLARKKAEYNPFLSKTEIIEPRLSPEERRMEFFSKHHRSYPGFDYFEFRYHVENIRIEKREQRDLLRDLQDVANGIEVFHASDMQKATAQKKQDAKQARSEVKERKKREKRLQAFYEHWNDPLWKRALIGWFGKEEYDRMKQEQLDKQSGVNCQIDLFGMMDPLPREVTVQE